MRIHAKHYATGRAHAVRFERDRIVELADSTEYPRLWFAPAFFDPQINGCLGHSFSSPQTTPDGFATIIAECRRHGIGEFLPTVITGESETMLACFRNLSRAWSSVWPGYHLEGPYLSGLAGARGAHPAQSVRDPDWDEFRRFQDAADGRIRMVTLAPERKGAVEFIGKLASMGIVVAIGHTNASTEQIVAAVDAGARTSTHLGNGCPAVLPRHPNILWVQLAEDRLWASVIADGHHIPASVLKTILRAKTLDRVLLTCDVGPLAGMPPGKYRDWGNDLEVLPDGKIIVAGTPFLAGSGHFTDTCVNTLLTIGVGLKDAIDLASVRPRQLFDLPVPEARVGDAGPWMLFEWEPGGTFRVEHTPI